MFRLLRSVKKTSHVKQIQSTFVARFGSSHHHDDHHGHDDHHHAPKNEIPEGDWRNEPVHIDLEQDPKNYYESYVREQIKESPELLNLTKGQLICEIRERSKEEDHFRSEVIGFSILGLIAAYYLFHSNVYGDRNRFEISEGEYYFNQLIKQGGLTFAFNEMRAFFNLPADEVAKLPAGYRKVYAQYIEQFRALEPVLDNYGTAVLATQMLRHSAPINQMRNAINQGLEKSQQLPMVNAETTFQMVNRNSTRDKEDALVKLYRTFTSDFQDVTMSVHEQAQTTIEHQELLGLIDLNEKDGVAQSYIDAVNKMEEEEELRVSQALLMGAIIKEENKEALEEERAFWAKAEAEYEAANPDYVAAKAAIASVELSD